MSSEEWCVATSVKEVARGRAVDRTFPSHSQVLVP